MPGDEDNNEPEFGGGPQGDDAENGGSDEIPGDDGAPEEPSLLCEECNQEKATIHITDLSGDQPVQKHLCKECARKLKEYPEVDESEIYAQLLGQIMPELKELTTKVCPACKTSYLMFRRAGRLGCDKCYEAFDPVMEAMVERIHGAKQHVGKIPPTADHNVAVESRIRTLEQLMQEAVAREEYERAARLRDEIRKMRAQPNR